jgi:hypothetical protein
MLRCRISLEHARHGEAIELGHAHVEQDEIRRHGYGPRVSLCAVKGNGQTVCALTQGLHEQAQLVRVIVHHQDMRQTGRLD